MKIILLLLICFLATSCGSDANVYLDVNRERSLPLVCINSHLYLKSWQWNSDPVYIPVYDARYANPTLISCRHIGKELEFDKNAISNSAFVGEEAK